MEQESEKRVMVFTKDVALGHTTYHAEEDGLSMYLIAAPKSRRFGYDEPRTYLEVNEANNYSQINVDGAPNAKEGAMIQTNFSKVRIRVSKNSKGVYIDKIDCTDFRFATTNGESFYCLD